MQQAQEQQSPGQAAYSRTAVNQLQHSVCNHETKPFGPGAGTAHKQCVVSKQQLTQAQHTARYRHKHKCLAVPLAGLAGARRSCQQRQAGHHHIHTGQECPRPGGGCSTYAAWLRGSLPWLQALPAPSTLHSYCRGSFGYAGVVKSWRKSCHCWTPWSSAVAGARCMLSAVTICAPYTAGHHACLALLLQVSGYIDYAHRLKTDPNMEAYFHRTKRLMPRQTDLSFYNWETHLSTSNPTPNFQVIALGHDPDLARNVQASTCRQAPNLCHRVGFV